MNSADGELRPLRLRDGGIVAVHDLAGRSQKDRGYDIAPMGIVIESLLCRKPPDGSEHPVAARPI